MKKTFVVMIFLLCGLSTFAQEKKMSAGAGLEWNMDSRHNFAGGAILNLDFMLPSNTALGINVIASHNFNAIAVIEPLVFYRRYVQDKDHTGFFVQLDGGAFVILEEGDVTTLFHVGVRGGYRIPLGSFFYIEPYGRTGYPFAFGFGAIAGICF